jgi:hypothetical protein
MIVGKQSFATDRLLTIDRKSIDIFIYHDNSDTWKNISIDEANKLLGKFELKLSNIGFDVVKTKFCGARQTKNMMICERSSKDAGLRLDVLLSAMKISKPKKGLSFTIETSDPRSPIIGRINVIPIDCKLSNGSGKQLLDTRRSEESIRKKYLHNHGFNANYLAEKLTNACKPLLLKQKLIVFDEQNNRPEKTSTEYPDVYIEKVVSREGEQQSGNDESISQNNNKDDNAVSPGKTQGDEQTQYVIYNRGDTLTIEFGQHRR